ncbi:CAAX geranylgeranyltransferase alpha subunit [Sorochytrium milnesiophthora]
MTSAIPYDEQPAWKDVKPVPQDDGPFPVVPINYSTEYSNAMNYFRAISLANEMSPRALELTGHIVELNSSHYTVWEYRKRLLLALNVDLESEIELLDRLLTDQPKNYQMWHHREVVIRELGDPTGELDFLASIFADDAKNYHAWLFRQWLVKHFKLWDRELQFINDMLMSDVRNNSAWNYRFFYYAQSPSSLVSGDAASVEQEVSFVLDKIRLAPSNESPWEYLRG